MDDSRLREVDSENIDIAQKIISDSEKIKISQETDKKVIDEIRGGRKKKYAFHKIYRMGTVVAACIVLVAGLIVWNQTKMGNTGYNGNVVEETTALQADDGKIVSSANASGKVASSYEEIKEKIDKVVSERNDIEKNAMSAGGVSGADGYSPVVSADDIQNSTSKLSTDYSGTNVQTKGVDEGDIVKTDGQYIYTLTAKENKSGEFSYYAVVITKVTGKKMENVFTIKLKDSAIENCTDISEIYVEGDRLIVIASSGYFTCGGIDDTGKLSGRGYNDSQTIVLIYDISDITSPKLISKNKQDGYCSETRMVGGYLYTISSWSVNDSNEDYIPKVNGEKIRCDGIYLPEIIEENTYTVITSMNVETGKDFKDSISVLGNGRKVYVSSDNIYLVNETTDEKDISDTEKGKKIIKQYMKKRDIVSEEKASEEEIARLKEDWSDEEYNYSSVTKKFKITITEYSDKMEILKYQYEQGKLTFIADCDLEGTTDDRFSLDEKDGYLRLVANVDKGSTLWAAYGYYDADGKEIEENYYDDKALKGSVNSNTVYTLDEKLNKKGEISGLAENEEIYAARYLGDYGYFVTYEQTDPLFSVDFTDMSNPKIVGELKMPGFSDYLQFYNDNLLFGIGMDDTTDEMSAVKMDMYNVSKGSAKRQTTLTLNGIEDSPALYNSKTLLMDSEKNIIGFPATEYIGNHNEYEIAGYYFVFSYENGQFHQLKKIKIEEENTYNTRGLYINHYLYIVMPEQIKAVNMTNYKIMGEISIK